MEKIMPGIFGIILKDRSKKERLKAQFDRMGKYLTHFDYFKIEPFDGSDFYIGQIGVPFRGYPHLRFDENTKRGMIFDGMMYGWRGESLKNDPARSAPVVNIEFEKFESLEKVPTLINGSFNSILFDVTKDCFYIVNSRLGNRSLYYYQNDELIAFAPEIKAFMALDSFKREADENGVIDILNYTFLACGRTLFKDVKRIDPATVLEIQNRRMLEPKRYWNYTFSEEIEGDIDAYAKQFYEKGEDILDRQMGQNENFFIALSGGMDSRMLAHYCANTSKNVNYYAHGYLKSEDVIIAREVAEKLSIGQHFSAIDIDPQNYAKLGNWLVWLVDGMTILHSSALMSVIQQYPEDPLQYEFLNSQFSGAINFCYGYGSEAYITKESSYDETLKKIALTYGSSYINEEYYSLFRPQVAQKMKDSFFSTIGVELDKHYNCSKYYINVLNRMTLDAKALRHMNSYDLYRYVYNWHFALIDDEIFEMLTKLPMKLGVDRNMYLRIYQNYVADLAKIRYEKTGVDLFSSPKPSWKKIKHFKERTRYYLGRLSIGKINLYDRYNYVQVNQWYRQYKANRRFFEDIILDKRTFDRGYFNESAVRTILKKQAHGSNYFGTISTLASIELFFRYFIDGDEPPVKPF